MAQQEQTGLRVVRVKNKFGLAEDDTSLLGGLRNVMVCVLFNSRSVMKSMVHIIINFVIALDLKDCHFKFELDCQVQGR